MNIAFDLNTVWFLLVGVLLTGYAILDGFDLGVGAIHLLAKSDEERRIHINAIGPVWDGNEVWLVTGGGALFAAFPEAYATAFSGFYLAMMLLLVGLIFRAVAIEFRSKQPMRWWRQFWDISFSVSSVLSGLLVGVALGNLALGVPLDSEFEFVGSFLGLLNPYALLVGLTGLSLFVMHGNIFLVMKTEGELHDRLRGWVNRHIMLFVVFYALATVATIGFVPRMLENLKSHAHPLHRPCLGFSRRRQHSTGDLPRPRFSSFSLFMLCHGGTPRHLRHRRLPESHCLQSGLRKQLEHLQCRFLRNHPRHHARHRDSGNAHRDCLHRQHLLDLSR